GRPAFDPADHRAALDEDERRDLLDLEALGEVRVLVGVDRDDGEPASFLAGDVRDQALHPPRRPRRALREEEEDRLLQPAAAATAFVRLFPGGSARFHVCCPLRSTQRTATVGIDSRESWADLGRL